jgi:glycosyltransferase involved in cell wall biosynthesis
MLPKEEAEKCALIMHTNPSDTNGTDLPAVIEAVCPDYDVIFSHHGLSDTELCYLYNIADVTINMASNEGFGLGTCEALMCGTPISVNVTGGLQDQCGFKFRDHFLTYKDYTKIESLHDWRKWENNKDLTHGEWVKPVWPRTRSVQGSVPTPFIMDDRVDWVDVADALRYWYDKSPEERKEAGLLGHEFVTGDDGMMSARHMSQLFIDHMETAFEKWTPRKSYEVHEV